MATAPCCRPSEPRITSTGEGRATGWVAGGAWRDAIAVCGRCDSPVPDLVGLESGREQGAHRGEGEEQKDEDRDCPRKVDDPAPPHPPSEQPYGDCDDDRGDAEPDGLDPAHSAVIVGAGQSCPRQRRHRSNRSIASPTVADWAA